MKKILSILFGLLLSGCSTVTLISLAVQDLGHEYKDIPDNAEINAAKYCMIYGGVKSVWATYPYDSPPAYVLVQCRDDMHHYSFKYPEGK